MINLDPSQVRGDLFQLARTNQNHVPGRFEVPTTEATGSFGEMVMDGLNQVNALEHQHADLSVRAIVDPDSVNPHDVTIAAAKAEMALNITKNVVDRVVQAYRDITNVR
ncbi:MAG: flagellar hook-basal body complex protein FliE [Spirochaetaceae bacterium]|nr:MAG: flagellar hook-basal body complex protein FliE [Spirochaetaceae bacterium]